MAPGDPENWMHLFRLQILIIDGGLLVLRNILDQTIAAQGLTLKACLNNERSKITRLHNCDVITQAQYELLFPKGGQDPTTADMDFTLIIILLANFKCFGLNKKFKWNGIPVSTDISLEADICRLRIFRDQICSIPTTIKIEKNDLTVYWNKIEQILIRQNTPGLNIHQTIADFKSCPLDSEKERRIKEEIKKWKDYEADVDRLKQEMGDVKENVTEMQTKFDDVKENVTKANTDLDDVKRNVMTVQEDLDGVKDNVTEVKSDMNDVKENVTEVKGLLDDVKENVAEVKSDLDDVKENVTEVKGYLDDVKENVAEVKSDLDVEKENVTEVRIGFDDVKGNVIKVQKDLEEVKRRQQTEGGSREVFPIQTEEEKYHTSKNDSVPDEVASDPRTRKLYQKALEKGTEKDNTIRVMVIGCFEQGKTSLVRNLLKQSIDGVETTNGIELHKCTVISDEEWKKLDNEDLNKETIKRLVNIALKEKKDETTSFVSKGEKCVPNEDTLISSSTTDILRTRNESVSFPKSGLENNAKSDEYEGKRKEGIQVSKFQIAVAAKSIVRNKKVSYENLTSFHTELEISESIQGKINLENNVTLNIWDFGGQFVFYATHQIFHSQQAVYLLVFNLSISLDTVIEDKEFPLHKKTMRDYLKFWVASVNSFVGSSDGMKPAIVLVGTHRDKLDAGNNSEDYFEQVRQLFEHSICINHIQPEHFAIANTSGSESEINALRTYISRLGQRPLEKIMPAKWILLEKALKINKQKKIITIDKLKQIDSETDSPLQTDNSTETMDQIKLFLSYHHAKGTFCYFDEDNLSNHVVLDPQFLVDAFRCVITSEKFCIVRPKLRNVWKELCNTAILRPELFDEVWRQDKDNNFYEFKHLLIEYMQKHHILAEALAYNLDSEPAVRRLGYFIVPSLLKTSSLSDDTIRSYLEGKQLSTVSLCYKFENETLTHFIFQACLAGIIGRWPLAKYIQTPLLFDHVAACDIERRHAGVLILSENKLELLVVSLCPPDNVKADVCDMFRRYVEVVIMKRMHKLHTDKHNVHFFSRAVRCLHKDHGTKGSYGTFDVDAINKIQSWNDEKIPCPDRRSHSLQMRSIVKEWFMPNVDQNEVPKRKLSTKEYSTLAMSIGKGWKLIGLQLGLNNIILEQICMTENDACMRIYNMFLKWDNKVGDQATLDVIVQAIEKCNPKQVHVELDVLKNMINGF